MGFHSPEKLDKIHPCSLYTYGDRAAKKKILLLHESLSKDSSGEKEIVRSNDSFRKILITGQRLFGFFNYEREGN